MLTRRLLALALSSAALAFTALAPASAKEWKAVRIATEGGYPPYNFTKPDGTLAGFEIDLAQELCKRAKLTCTVVSQNWDGILPGLTGGKYDAIMSGMSITAKRREVIDFTAPYVSSPTTFATLKGSGLENLPGTGARFNLNDDAPARAAIEQIKPKLQGKVVGVQVSTIQADLANNYLKGVVQVRNYKTADELVLDLSAGRIDAAIASAAVLQASMDKPEGREIAFSGPTFTGGPIGIGSGIGIRKTDPELRDLFDQAIKEVTADGTLAKLSMQWFNLDLTPR